MKNSISSYRGALLVGLAALLALAPARAQVSLSSNKVSKSGAAASDVDAVVIDTARGEISRSQIRRRLQIGRVTNFTNYAAWPEGKAWLTTDGGIGTMFNRGASHNGNDLAPWVALCDASGNWSTLKQCLGVPPSLAQGATCWAAGKVGGALYAIIKYRGSSYVHATDGTGSWHALMHSSDEGLTWTTDIADIDFTDSGEVPVMFHGIAGLPDGRIVTGFHFSNGRVGLAFFDPADSFSMTTVDLYSSAAMGGAPLLVEPDVLYDANTSRLFVGLRTQSSSRPAELKWSSDFATYTTLVTGITEAQANLPLTLTPDGTKLVTAIIGRRANAKFQIVEFSTAGLLAGNGTAAMTVRDYGTVPWTTARSAPSGTGVPAIITQGNDVVIIFSVNDGGPNKERANIFIARLNYGTTTDHAPDVSTPEIQPAYTDTRPTYSGPDYSRGLLTFPGTAGARSFTQLDAAGSNPTAFALSVWIADDFTADSTNRGIVQLCSANNGADAADKFEVALQYDAGLTVRRFGATISDYRRLYFPANLIRGGGWLIISYDVTTAPIVWWNGARLTPYEKTGGTAPDWSRAIVASFLVQGTKTEALGGYAGTMSPASYLNHALDDSDVAAFFARGCTWQQSDLWSEGYVQAPRCSVLGDTSTYQQQALITSAVGRVTTRRDWYVVSRFATTSAIRMLNAGGTFSDYTRIRFDSCTMDSAGTGTVTLGSASGGAQYKASGALTTGRNAISLVTPFPTTNDVWFQSSSTATVTVTLRGHQID